MPQARQLPRQRAADVAEPAGPRKRSGFSRGEQNIHSLLAPLGIEPRRHEGHDERPRSLEPPMDADERKLNSSAFISVHPRFHLLLFPSVVLVVPSWLTLLYISSRTLTPLAV